MRQGALPAARSAQALAFVVNDLSFFLRHFGMLAEASVKAGYQVHVVAPADSIGSIKLPARDGFRHHPVPVNRSSMNPLRELWTLAAIIKVLRSLQPAVVHAITIKPVIYAGLAVRAGLIGRSSRRPLVVVTIPGLGYVFTAKGIGAALLRGMVKAAYRLALGGAQTRVVFQNQDDLAQFGAAGIVPRGSSLVIHGSGIDLEVFRPRPLPPGEPIVLLPARMLWDKGVGEFVEAARILRADGVCASFVLAGGTDPSNPAAISAEQLAAWQSEGAVSWWGHREDMPTALAEASIVCLPSYREGLPRALIEAAACGRPIVATDVPGCRELVIPGETGALVPARDPRALAAGLRALIEQPALRRIMGQNARRFAEMTLDPKVIIGRHLELYAGGSAEAERNFVRHRDSAA